MNRTCFAISLTFCSLFAFAQNEDESSENNYAYLTLDFGYIGSFYEDEGLSAVYKIGGIAKNGVGFSLGYSQIRERKTLPSGDLAGIKNSCVMGGFQVAYPHLWKKYKLGLGGEFGLVLTYREHDGGYDHDLVYLRTDGLYYGFDFSLHILLTHVMRLEIGYFSSVEYKPEDGEDRESLSPRLKLGIGILIPASR